MKRKFNFFKVQEANNVLSMVIFHSGSIQFCLLCCEMGLSALILSITLTDKSVKLYYKVV